MSDLEEEGYNFFGKPLEQYDEDAFPKKKPIAIEDQIATDAQGRRRFHGAFTGGFSAGFFNTVGSLEGWTPSEFRSTRQDKARNVIQKPQDFMDDEDVSEFGIAPQSVRATKDFSTSKKRRKQVFQDGPIPGEPVLHSLLTSGNETIGYLLLRNIGLKGKTKEMEAVRDEKVYGCEIPRVHEITHDNENQFKIADIYKEYLKKTKDNSFGLGYIGLDSSHLNLFQSAKLVIKDKNKKKVSISGQAFGVGAFEDDDEDIYVREDMSRYDFELTSEKVSKAASTKKSEKIFDDFVASRNILLPKETFLPPTIPHSFSGKHKLRRSRFEPIPEEAPLPRKNMNAETRARCLGEDTLQASEANKQDKNEESSQNKLAVNVKEEKSDASEVFSITSATGLIFDRFVNASKLEDVTNILEPVQKSETEHGTQEMRDAARMKMFGPLTRISMDWQPCSLLCKRFNVPEPNLPELDPSKNRKRTKNLIFEIENFSELDSSKFKAGLSSFKEETISQTENEVIMESEEAKSSDSTVEENTEKQNSVVDEPIKDITDKIDISKNTDLFKAVFLSSSESEDEEENETIDKSTEMKNSILSDSMLPKIKPIKEGILSNMDFTLFNAIPKVAEQKPEESQEDVTLHYGPVLPTNLPVNLGKNPTSKNSSKGDDDCDEWIEKSDKEKSKSHRKKHKSKSSHKKKHKHSKNR